MENNEKDNKKYSNDFNGFTHLLTTDSLINVFEGWLTKSKFTEKFGDNYNLNARIEKDNDQIIIKYLFDYTSFEEQRDIDINYLIECLKYVIPYENIKGFNVYKNSQNRFTFFDKLKNKPFFKHGIEIDIPFTL